MDRSPAAAAGQPLTAVGVQGAVEVAGLAVDVDVQAVEAGATGDQGRVHHVPDVPQQLKRAGAGEAGRRALVVDAGPPQRLVRVDVADAADQRLVEQRPFDRGPLAAQCLVEGLVVEERVERVTGDVRDDVGQALGGVVVQRQTAEGALVDEAQLGVARRALLRRLRLGEADTDPQVLLVRRGVRLHQQLAAHAEVGQDRLVRVLQRQPQVLAAAARDADAVPLQPVREVVRAG